MSRRAALVAAAAALIAPSLALAAPAPSAETQAALDSSEADLASLQARLATLGRQAESAQYESDQAAACANRVQEELDSVTSELSEAQAALDDAEDALSEALAACDDPDAVRAVAYSDVATMDTSAVPASVRPALKSAQQAAATASGLTSRRDSLSSSQEALSAAAATAKRRMDAAVSSLQEQVDARAGDVEVLQARAQAEIDAKVAAGVHSDVVGYAMQFLGTPYVWGAMDPSVGFDCSGLAGYCYMLAGYSIPRTTYELIDHMQAIGTWVTDFSQIKPGDLIFPFVGHVQIYAGDGMVVEAPAPGSVVSYNPVSTFIGGGNPVGD